MNGKRPDTPEHPADLALRDAFDVSAEPSAPSRLNARRIVRRVRADRLTRTLEYWSPAIAGATLGALLVWATLQSVQGARGDHRQPGWASARSQTLSLAKVPTPKR